MDPHAASSLLDELREDHDLVFPSRNGTPLEHHNVVRSHVIEGMGGGTGSAMDEVLG